MYHSTRAIVASEPTKENDFTGSQWSLQSVQVPSSLKPDDLLVSIVATGICHSDLVVTGYSSAKGFAYPRIAGHEGAGYVQAIGSAVTKDVRVGDPVLLSFCTCGECGYCTSDRGRRVQCEQFRALNLFGEKDVFRTEDGKGGIAGKFFGQSSFANLTVVNQSSVLLAKGLIENDEELKLFAPLGCGLQTGAGAVFNTVQAKKEDSVMVIGLGGVGLAAVMAAKITGCREIIAVDRVASRMELATELGATDTLDTTGIEDLAKAFKSPGNGGLGPDIIIDTTGVSAILTAAYAALANLGSLVLVGVVADPNAIKVDLAQHMSRAIKLVGCKLGGSLPEEFVPKLIEYYRAGKFPMDRLTKYYKAEDFKAALHDMHSGATVKPVLLW